MGRSVSFLNNAVCKAYFNVDENEDFHFLIYDIQQYITSKYPEFSKCDKWQGNEDHIILEGYGCIIAISEYCGLCCLSIAVEPIEYYDEEEEEAINTSSNAVKWIETFWGDMVAPWNKYRSVGRFSNGGQIFEKIGG